MSDHDKRQRQRREELALIDEPSGILPWESMFVREYVLCGHPLEAFKKVCATHELQDSDQALRMRATNLMRKPAVKRYLNHLNQRLEDMGVCSMLEVQIWLSDVMRTPVGMIDQNDPLCQKHRKTIRIVTQKDGSTLETETEEFESVSKLEAAKALIRMKGWDAPVKVDVNHQGGVMLVPMALDAAEWEKHASGHQERLMNETIDI